MVRYLDSGFVEDPLRPSQEQVQSRYSVEFRCRRNSLSDRFLSRTTLVFMLKKYCINTTYNGFDRYTFRSNLSVLSGPYMNGDGGGGGGEGSQFQSFSGLLLLSFVTHICRVCLFDFDDLQLSFQLQRSPALAETAI